MDGFQLQKYYKKVDLTTDRNQYKIFDFSTISLHPKNYIKSKTLTVVHLRSYPKWTSPSIKSIDILTEVIISKYTENKEWIEVTCSVLNQKISGWIPTYSIDTSDFYKTIHRNNEKYEKTKAMKDNNFRIKVIKVNQMRRSESQETLNYKEKEKQVRFETKAFCRRKSESIQRLEEVKLENNRKFLTKILANKYKRKAISILFKFSLFKCWAKWRKINQLLPKIKVKN